MPKLNSAATLFFKENKKQLSLDESKRCFKNPDDKITGFNLLEESIDSFLNEKLACKDTISLLSKDYSLCEVFSRFETSLWLATITEKEPFGSNTDDARILKEEVLRYANSEVNPFKIQYKCFSAKRLIKTVSDFNLAVQFKSEDFRNWVYVEVELAISPELQDFLKENNLPALDSPRDGYLDREISSEWVDFLRILAGYSILFEDKMNEFKQKLHIAEALANQGFKPDNSAAWLDLIKSICNLEKSLSGKGFPRKLALDVAKAAATAALS